MSKYQKANGVVGLKTKLSPSKLATPSKLTKGSSSGKHKVNKLEKAVAISDEIMNIQIASTSSAASVEDEGDTS